eukprot:g2707.t1
MDEDEVEEDNHDADVGGSESDSFWADAIVPAGVPLGVEATSYSTKTAEDSAKYESPGEEVTGAISVSPLDLNPLQLIRAMEPWRQEKMKRPNRMLGNDGLINGLKRQAWFMEKNKHNFRNPWDTDEDVTQNQPFHVPIEGSVPPHAPPDVLGDGDAIEEDEGKEKNVWGNTVSYQPMIFSPPAFYSHGYKPKGYYLNPYGKIQKAPWEKPSFLETASKVNLRGATTIK